MSENQTVAEVVDALGGNPVVAEIAGVGVTAVSNWRAWNCFPPRLYLTLRNFARQKKVKMPDSLFRERVSGDNESTRVAS